MSSALPETSTGDLSPSASAELIAARDPAALVVGPGIRESDGYGALIGLLLESEGAPTVVDGGALNLLAAREHWWQGSAREAVLTPHPGEFARLTGAAAGTGEADRHAGCAAAAARFGQVVVLKGARTIVCAPDGRASISPFANAALATAGTGDVLAGTIGALLAQAVPAYEAACLGVWLHGRAAERIGAEVGDSGLAASDLPREIARARRELATGAA